VTLDRSWQLGSPASLPYRAYDGLRDGVNRRLASFFSGELEHLERCRVLEAGSGPARATSLLGASPKVGLAVALDLDPEALEEGRKRDPRLPAVAADVHRLPFPEGTFDLVWNSSTLEHLPALGPPLREMARVCRPGGAVFVGVPYKRGPLCFQPLIARTAVGIWLGPVFNRRELEGEFVRAGLEPERHLLYFLRFFVGVLGRKPPRPA